MSELPTVFCLASGRSGTHFLYEILRRNTCGTICRHEPYVLNPSMFGRAIYDLAVGDEASLRRVAEKKRRVIESYQTATAYIETSHAFLKSWSQLAIEFFPRMKLVHLVRDPLKVALSEANREALIHRWRVPLRNYRGADGKTYFRWSLTGLEPIFQNITRQPLTRFQWYVVQWIEIENRAQSFIRQQKKQSDTFVLHSPSELNDTAKVRSLLDWLQLPRGQSEVVLQGRKNRTPGIATTITDRELEQFVEVIAALPKCYLEIFQHPPYSQWEWSERLG